MGWRSGVGVGGCRRNQSQIFNYSIICTPVVVFFRFGRHFTKIQMPLGKKKSIPFLKKKGHKISFGFQLV